MADAAQQIGQLTNLLMQEFQSHLRDLQKLNAYMERQYNMANQEAVAYKRDIGALQGELNSTVAENTELKKKIERMQAIIDNGGEDPAAPEGEKVIDTAEDSSEMPDVSDTTAGDDTTPGNDAADNIVDEDRGASVEDE